MNIQIMSDEDEQVNAICNFIRKEVTNLLNIKNQIVIAVSGGKSPINLFKKLNQLDIAWEKITITLVDERIVPMESEDSNEFLIKNFLIKNKATKVTFISLLKNQNNLTNIVNYIDIAILGMGIDGHFASIFADAKEYNEAITTNNTYLITNPVSVNFSRISLSLNAILKIPALILSIAGKVKFNVINEAYKPLNTHYPINLLVQKRKDITIFWYT